MGLTAMFFVSLLNTTGFLHFHIIALWSEQPMGAREIGVLHSE